jgi:hypothetical protein
MPSNPKDKKVASVDVALTPSLREWLKNYAREQDQSMAGVIRQVLVGLRAHQEESRSSSKLVA